MLTDLDWLRVGEEFPPPSERDRLHKYAENRKLWDNRHTEVYGDWWRVLRDEYGVSHEIVFGFHERLSTLWANLVFGDAPVFDASRAEGQESREGEKDSEQETLDRIVESSQFVTAGREAVIDGSRYGDGLFKLRLKAGKGFLQAQSPAIWYPVASLDDQREVLYHVLAWTFEKDDVTYLRAEVHAKGYIENHLFLLEGSTITAKLDLAKFFPDRDDREETKLLGFMVFHAPGERASDEFFGKDDYGKIDSLVLERMARAAQLSRIQDMHSDPNMYGDAGLVQDGQFEAGGKFLPVDKDGVVPGYLTWDGKQDAQFKLMETLKEDLYVVSETTPTAFGSSATGYAESGTSLRLRMQPPLAKARNIARRFDPVVKEALLAACELEKAWGVEGAAVPETINVTWKDGLPNDPKEQAEIERTRLESRNTSRYSSIRRLDGGTDEEIREEIRRMDEEDGETEDPATAAVRDIFGGAANGSQRPGRNRPNAQTNEGVSNGQRQPPPRQQEA